MDFWCEVIVKESGNVIRFYRGENAQMVQVFDFPKAANYKDLIAGNLRLLFGGRPFKILNIKQI